MNPYKTFTNIRHSNLLSSPMFPEHVKPAAIFTENSVFDCSYSTQSNFSCQAGWNEQILSRYATEGCELTAHTSVLLWSLSVEVWNGMSSMAMVEEVGSCVAR